MRRFAFALVLTSIAACAPKTDPKYLPPDQKANTPEPAAPTVFEGSWLSGCNSVGQIRNLTAHNATAVMTLVTYADATCTGFPKDLAVSTFTIKIGDAVAGIAGASQADLILSSTVRTLKTAAAATAANQSLDCGLSTWASGVALDVTGKNCSSALTPYGLNLNAGDVLHDIFRIADSSAGKVVCFGLQGPSLDAAGRPTALAPEQDCFAQQ